MNEVTMKTIKFKGTEKNNRKKNLILNKKEKSKERKNNKLKKKKKWNASSGAFHEAEASNRIA